jgi:hypothetical protein
VNTDNWPERASTLLNDEFFTSVVEKQQQGYISTILNSSETDVDLRERALIKHRAIEEFIASIQSIADKRAIEKKRFKIF